MSHAIRVCRCRYSALRAARRPWLRFPAKRLGADKTEGIKAARTTGLSVFWTADCRTGRSAADLPPIGITPSPVGPCPIRHITARGGSRRVVESPSGRGGSTDPLRPRSTVTGEEQTSTRQDTLPDGGNPLTAL